MLPIVIAHRGWSAKAPENTMAAFREAMRFGVDGIELDVHMTRDGHVVICHDDRLDRTTNGAGLIAEHTLDEIRRLDAGSWFSPEFAGEPLPTLRELLEAIAASSWRGVINIELKTTGADRYPGMEKAVADLLRAFDLTRFALISSFDHDALAETKRVDEELETAILYASALDEPWAYAERLRCRTLHPVHTAATSEIIAGAHAHGVKVNAWTVDHPERARELARAGVDGIITNRPDVVRQTLAALP